MPLSDKRLLNDIKKRISEIESPPRQAFSKKFPLFKGVIIFVRCSVRQAENFFSLGIGCRRSRKFYPCVLARHQSVLLRQLGESDIRLQRQKVINLKQAIKQLDGLIIPPGQTFSFWHQVGRPSRNRGYVNGMLLSNGKVIEGLGGGLCQLSNFLCWIFLHADVEIVERYHHSMDTFPDSGRTLPFGSGATILYNFVDFRVKNISDHSIQLKIWLTDRHLKGQLLSTTASHKKFHLEEKNHLFIKKNGKYYRFNEIWRETLLGGKAVKEELIFSNLAPVMYRINESDIKKQGYKLLNIK